MFAPPALHMVALFAPVRNDFAILEVSIVPEVVDVSVPAAVIRTGNGQHADFFPNQFFDSTMLLERHVAEFVGATSAAECRLVIHLVATVEAHVALATAGRAFVNA